MIIFVFYYGKFQTYTKIEQNKELSYTYYPVSAIVNILSILFHFSVFLFLEDRVGPGVVKANPRHDVFKKHFFGTNLQK